MNSVIEFFQAWRYIMISNSQMNILFTNMKALNKNNNYCKNGIFNMKAKTSNIISLTDTLMCLFHWFVWRQICNFQMVTMVIASVSIIRKMTFPQVVTGVIIKYYDPWVVAHKFKSVILYRISSLPSYYRYKNTCFHSSSTNKIWINSLGKRVYVWGQ